jgi:hypothetical protein
MRKGLWAGMLVGGITMLGAGTDARAATVTVTSTFAEGGHCNYCGEYLGTEVAVIAVPGEVNRLSVTRDGDHVVLHDASAPLTPTALPPDTNPSAVGPPCVAVDANTVTCTPPRTVIAALGDGDDTASLGDGAGNAAFTGGPGDDVLTGGSGPDRLDGGAGHDELHGGAGNDLLVGAEPAPAPDALDGGPGDDTVDYSGGGGPLRIDLRTQTVTGAPIGTDTLAAIENATGSTGPDTITGDDGPNRLIGDDGVDLIRGGAGDDDLYGGSPDVATSPIPDRVDGGAGNDRIDVSYGWIDEDDLYSTLNFSANGKADGIRCGSGRDRVTFADVHDALPLDCDEVSPDAGTEVGAPTLFLDELRAGRRSLTVTATRAYGRPRLRAAGGHHEALSARVPAITVDERATVRFVLNAAGRRVARRGRPAIVRIVGLVDDQGTASDLAVALPRL